MNKPTLGGATFCYNAISQDYCIIESLECLYDLCDEVSVSYGGTDGSVDLIEEWVLSKGKFPKPIHLHRISEKEWASQQGREKLSYFSNIAIEKLTTDYFYYQQADEVTTEASFSSIREAIEIGNESYLVSRLNLWASPFTVLNVEQNRKPVSTKIIRLAKKRYRCIGDAESLGVPYVDVSFLNDIKIFHMGFVRQKDKHIHKIKHMQKEVFLMDYDKRADIKDIFDPWIWGFGPEDVEPIKEPLPWFIQKWASEREYDPFQKDSDGYNIAIRFFNVLGQDVDDKCSSLKTEEFLQFANHFWWRLVKQYQNKKPS